MNSLSAQQTGAWYRSFYTLLAGGPRRKESTGLKNEVFFSIKASFWVKTIKGIEKAVSAVSVNGISKSSKQLQVLVVPFPS